MFRTFARAPALPYTHDRNSSVKIAICGPIETDYLRRGLGIDLPGAPPGMGGGPVNIEIVELCRRGIPLTVVTEDTSIVEPVGISESMLRLSYLPARPRARHRALDFFRQEVSSMAQELTRARPDIVHAHWSYEFAMAGLRSGLPLVITCHDSPWDVLRHFHDPYRLIRFLMALSVCLRRGVFTAVSPYLKNRNNWMVRGECTVIPNGIDLADLPVRSRASARGPKSVLVTLGNASKLKNITAALSAFRLIRREVPSAELHLFGHGLTSEQIPLAEGVHPHGQRPYPEVMAFLCERADLMIHPSLEESFCMAALEAQAVGLPVIGGAESGGVPYVIGDSASDCLVNVRDPVAIANAAVRILKDEDLYASLSARAVENVRRRFTAKAMVDDYLKILAGVLDSKTQGRTSVETGSWRRRA